MAMDLSNLRQLPALSHRPNFPHDLHVLLLDSDFKARQEAEAQLRENQYSVTPCSCSIEAAAFLANPENSCDVLLADVRCLQQKSAEHAAVVKAAKSIPLVLMSDCGAPSEVMLGIKLGAVDFLDKPLSPLKLKNIWQHLVRRLFFSSGVPASLKKGNATSGTSSPEDSGSLGGGGSGAHSHGESGSNASTSDQAPMKVDYDADMETSSFQDALGCSNRAAANTAQDGCGAAAAAASPGGTGGGSSGHDVMQVENGGSIGANKPRPQAHKYKANRTSAPSGPGNGGGCGGSSHGACSIGGAPKPAVGYPAGQMPPLPADVPGIAWGLPTNPLQISPKAGLMGPMGCWPGGPVMAPPPFFPPMFPMGSPAASVPSLPSVGGCGSLHLSASCMTLSSAANNAAANASTTCSNASGAQQQLCMKRADSAPLPAPSCISNGSAATGMGLAGLPGADCFAPPPPPSRASCGGGLAAAELFSSLETGKPLLSPPIGLQLRKSASFLNIIAQTLEGAAAC